MFIYFVGVNLFFFLVQLNSVDRIFYKVLQLGIIDSGRWIGDLEGKGDVLSESSYLLVFDNFEFVGNIREVGRE